MKSRAKDPRRAAFNEALKERKAERPCRDGCTIAKYARRCGDCGWSEHDRRKHGYY